MSRVDPIEAKADQVSEIPPQLNYAEYIARGYQQINLKHKLAASIALAMLFNNLSKERVTNNFKHIFVVLFGEENLVHLHSIHYQLSHHKTVSCDAVFNALLNEVWPARLPQHLASSAHDVLRVSSKELQKRIVLFSKLGVTREGLDYPAAEEIVLVEGKSYGENCFQCFNATNNLSRSRLCNC